MVKVKTVSKNPDPDYHFTQISLSNSEFPRDRKITTKSKIELIT